MYQPWKPLGHNLEAYPGLDVSIQSRSIKIVLTNWLNGNCYFALELSFKHALAGFFIYDESTNHEGQIGMPATTEFDNEANSGNRYPAWVERDSKRLALYAEYGKMNYQRIDSYFIEGQQIVLVIDVADADPAVIELSSDSINRT